ncbi:UDP-N-acetylmuramate dehydrogenase [Faucicola boevrei]|uniref:UDP-N-acetylmuramate dehydrogenase n=1 Tax=Faucicola boevrei TaxID=346665 RepID=UPI000375032E|nr:UDP-N-acetylmuramate dehydrogenase [Moraxella boevrei]
MSTQNTATTYPTDISHLNTMALACQARELVCLQQLDEILPLFQRLTQQNQRFIVISNGSNILLPSTLDATVISPTLKGKSVVHECEKCVHLEVMAGEVWHDLVVDTVAKGWYGLQNLALIPSWVGACPVQNIGAYGVQVEDLIRSVTAFHIPTLSFKTLSKAECEFGYRDSIFKREAGDWLIVSVTFKLLKDPTVNTQYGDVALVAQEFAKNANRAMPTPTDVMHAIIQIRESKIPDTKVLANCGSFFKNPIIDKAIADKLRETYPALVEYPVKIHDVVQPELTKLASGWLIDEAGLKGKGVFPIVTHVNQALVLTNHAPQQATQSDVVKAMQLIQDTVAEKFGIRLEPEPVWIQSDGTVRQTH